MKVIRFLRLVLAPFGYFLLAVLWAATISIWVPVVIAYRLGEWFAEFVGECWRNS